MSKIKDEIIFIRHLLSAFQAMETRVLIITIEIFHQDAVLCV